TVRIAVPAMASLKIAVAKRPCRLFGIVPVAAHDVPAAGHQFTELAHGNPASLFVDHLDIDAGSRASAGGESCIGMVKVLKYCEEASLAHAVALLQLDVRQHRSRPAD